MYGLTVFGSIILGLFLAEKGLNARDRAFLWKSAFWMIIGGIVGARLYHVLDFSQHYFNEPLSVLKVWQGGLGIFGALLGAVVTFYVVGALEKRKNVEFNFLAGTDIFAFYAPLAQALGRFANFYNNELLPYALYESAFSIVLFGFFVFLRKFHLSKLFRGFYSGAYLIGYGVIRLTLEQTRTEHWAVEGIYVAHIFSILFIIVGIGIVVYGKKHYGVATKTNQKHSSRT